jgi:hypothetical protein
VQIHIIMQQPKLSHEKPHEIKPQPTHRTEALLTTATPVRVSLQPDKTVQVPPYMEEMCSDPTVNENAVSAKHHHQNKQ